MRWLAGTLLLFTCGQQPPAPPAPAPAPAPVRSAEQTGARVILPDGAAIQVEVVADNDMRAQGLMFRDRLRPGTGMLFMFAQDGHYPFWMKNTLIPLDMIWIDSERRIAHVKHDVPPCKVQDCPSYPPNVPARYVLELAAGVAREHGLKAGDQLRFEGTDNVTVR